MQTDRQTLPSISVTHRNIPIIMMYQLLLLVAAVAHSATAMNAAEVAGKAGDLDCPGKLVPAALKACNVVTPQVLEAVLTCTKHLDIKIPCAFIAIINGEDWSECDDDIEIWMEFGTQVRSKCLAKCAFQGLGLMDEEGLLLESRFFHYLHTHFFEDGGLTDAHRNNFTMCMQNPPETSMFNPFGEKENGKRAIGCFAAENAIECSIPIVVDRVMSCMSGVCQRIMEDQQGARKKRSFFLPGF